LYRSKAGETPLSAFLFSVVVVVVVFDLDGLSFLYG
jgi:hypothetical protein